MPTVGQTAMGKMKDDSSSQAIGQPSITIRGGAGGGGKGGGLAFWPGALVGVPSHGIDFC